MNAVVCRLCGKSDKKLLDVFFSNDKNLTLKVYQCFGVWISRDDTITKSICRECFFFTNSAYDHRIHSLGHDAKLKRENRAPKIKFPSDISQKDFLVQFNLADKNHFNTLVSTRTTMHPSVRKLKRKYPNLIIPPNCMKVNVDPVVVISPSPAKKAKINEIKWYYKKPASAATPPQKKKPAVKILSVVQTMPPNSVVKTIPEVKTQPAIKKTSPVVKTYPGAKSIVNNRTLRSNEKNEITQFDKNIPSTSIQKDRCVLKVLLERDDSLIQFLTSHTATSRPTNVTSNVRTQSSNTVGSDLLMRNDEIATYICQTCNKVFDSKLLLCQHKRHHHKSSLRCGRCSMKFSVVEQLMLHMASHKPIPVLPEEEKSNDSNSIDELPELLVPSNSREGIIEHLDHIKSTESTPKLSTVKKKVGNENYSVTSSSPLKMTLKVRKDSVNKDHGTNSLTSPELTSKVRKDIVNEDRVNKSTSRELRSRKEIIGTEDHGVNSSRGLRPRVSQPRKEIVETEDPVNISASREVRPKVSHTRQEIVETEDPVNSSASLEVRPKDSQTRNEIVETEDPVNSSAPLSLRPKVTQIIKDVVQRTNSLEFSTRINDKLKQAIGTASLDFSSILNTSEDNNTEDYTITASSANNEPPVNVVDEVVISSDSDSDDCAIINVTPASSKISIDNVMLFALTPQSSTPKKYDQSAVIEAAVNSILPRNDEPSQVEYISGNEIFQPVIESPNHVVLQNRIDNCEQSGYLLKFASNVPSNNNIVQGETTEIQPNSPLTTVSPKANRSILRKKLVQNTSPKPTDNNGEKQGELYNILTYDCENNNSGQSSGGATIDHYTLAYECVPDSSKENMYIIKPMNNQESDILIQSLSTTCSTNTVTTSLPPVTTKAVTSGVPMKNGKPVIIRGTIKQKVAANVKTSVEPSTSSASSDICVISDDSGDGMSYQPEGTNPIEEKDKVIVPAASTISQQVESSALTMATNEKNFIDYILAKCKADEKPTDVNDHKRILRKIRMKGKKFILPLKVFSHKAEYVKMSFSKHSLRQPKNGHSLWNHNKAFCVTKSQARCAEAKYGGLKKLPSTSKPGNVNTSNISAQPQPQLTINVYDSPGKTTINSQKPFVINGMSYQSLNPATSSADPLQIQQIQQMPQRREPSQNLNIQNIININPPSYMDILDNMEIPVHIISKDVEEEGLTMPQKIVEQTPPESPKPHRPMIRLKHISELIG